jgi:hypothetical protein
MTNLLKFTGKLTFNGIAIFSFALTGVWAAQAMGLGDFWIIPAAIVWAGFAPTI